MKNRMTAVTRFLPGCCLFLACVEAMAQGVLVPPPAARAIESQLQQERTRGQREVLEAQRAVPLLPSRPATAYSPQVMTAPRAAPSRVQNLDDEAIFERPAPPRGTKQIKRKVTQ